MRQTDQQSLRAAFAYASKVADRSIECEKDYRWIVENPAYTDFSPRTIAGMNKDKIASTLECVANEINKYMKEGYNGSFDNWHKNTCQTFIDNLWKYYGIKIHFGKAQKLVNMTFKYLYCTNGSEKYAKKFEPCHMPLDTYTINWFCDSVVAWLSAEKPKISKTQIKKISWGNLECGKEDEPYSYTWMQTKIREYLNSESNTQYRDSDGKPLTPFVAEFYIWPEQQFSEACKSLLGQALYQTNFPAYADPQLLDSCDKVFQQMQNLKRKLTDESTR